MGTSWSKGSNKKRQSENGLERVLTISWDSWENGMTCLAMTDANAIICSELRAIVLLGVSKIRSHWTML